MIPPSLLPARSPEAHKGQAGRVAVVAGSRTMSGAAALCVMGALRGGAGRVTLGIPKGLHAPLVVKLTECMFRPLPETNAGSLSTDALPEAAELINGADVGAVGPGLSTQPQTQECVRQLLSRTKPPLILDADALNAIAQEPGALKAVTARAVITPHAGEMGRLVTLSAADVQRDRERIAREFAKRHGVVVVLKGQGTVVADVDGAVYVNNTGNPGMATGGSGDVLTGLIAALVGQGLGLYDAARLGAYLHGLAGDLAAQAQGGIGLIASDVADRIPHAIRQYQQS